MGFIVLPVCITTNESGLQDGATPNEALNIAQMHFSKADTNKDGQISFDEFEKLHQATSAAQARKNFHVVVGQQAASKASDTTCESIALPSLPFRHGVLPSRGTRLKQCRHVAA